MSLRVVLQGLLFYAAVPAVQVAVASTFLSRSLRVEAPAPPPANAQTTPVAPPDTRDPGPPVQVQQEMPHDPVSLRPLIDGLQHEPQVPEVPDPLREPVVLDAAKERSLLNLHAYLDKDRAIQEAAAACLGAVVEWVASYEEQIRADMRNGGPMADPGFRKRWNALVHPVEDAKWITLGDPDPELGDDLLANRPVTKARLINLADYARTLRGRLGHAQSWERSLAEFLRMLPPERFPTIGHPDLAPDFYEQLKNRDFLAAAFYDGRVRGPVRMPLGPKWGKNQFVSVDANLVYFSLVRGQGLVPAAYRSQSMDHRESAAVLVRAETLLRDFLEGEPFGGPESWTVRVVPPVTEAAPKAEAAAAPPPFPGRPRQWTDVRGRNFYGRITAAKGGEVRLEGPDRRWLWTPVLNLSDYDRYYVESFLAGREPDYEPPVRRRPKKMDPAAEMGKLFGL